MCLAQGVLDNLISHWWKCVSSCCWSWYCRLLPEAGCALHPATLPSWTLWQPLSPPVRLLCYSTTQKGKTTHICSETCSEALNTSHYAIPPRDGWIIFLNQSDGMVLLALPWPQVVAISLVVPLHHRWPFPFVISKFRELTCQERTLFF